MKPRPKPLPLQDDRAISFASMPSLRSPTTRTIIDIHANFNHHRTLHGVLGEAEAERGDYNDLTTAAEALKGRAIFDADKDSRVLAQTFSTADGDADDAVAMVRFGFPKDAVPSPFGMGPSLLPREADEPDEPEVPPPKPGPGELVRLLEEQREGMARRDLEHELYAALLEEQLAIIDLQRRENAERLR